MIRELVIGFALNFSIVFAVCAIPSFDRLPVDALPLNATPEELVVPGQEIVMPNGRSVDVSVKQVEDGMAGVLGRTDSGDRLYAFVHKGEILSADVYSNLKRWRLIKYGLDYYWIEAQAYPAERRVSESSRNDVVGRMEWLGSRPKAGSPSADGSYDIDVLVFYTDGYANGFDGLNALRAEVERLIFITNGYFESSEVPVRFHIANLLLLNGVEDETDIFATLDEIAADATIRRLRDEVGADLVHLLMTTDGEGCGLAAGFNGLKRAEGDPDNVDPERDAFSVSRMGAGKSAAPCEDQTLAHELGHQLGGGHAYALQEALLIASESGIPEPNYFRPYSHGHYCGSVASRPVFRSILSSLPYDGTFNINGLLITGPGALSSGDLFTNPGLTIGGEVCGSEGVPGVELTQADNAKAMTEAAPYVAAYRQATELESKGTAAAGALTEFEWVFLLMGVGLKIRRRHLIYVD